MTLAPKAKSLLSGALFVIGVFMVFGILLAMFLANAGASLEAERARDLIKGTRKNCVKYAESETVTRDWRVRKAEMCRCPEGRLVALQK